MSENIKCPNCGTLIDVDEVFNHQAEEKYKKEFEEKLRNSNAEILKQKETFALQQKEFEEKKAKENEIFLDRIEKERQRIAKEENEKAKKSSGELLKVMEEQLVKKDAEINSVRKKELEIINERNELKTKSENLELEVQKQLQVKQQELEENISKREQEKNQLKFKEFEKKLADQNSLIDEMKRKAEQGSMQLQGEVLELALEGLLKEAFPFDLIEEVGKGVRGADCIQTVRNNFGQQCGKIIYESKRTQAFSNEWIEKLKADMRAQNADIAVIVTQTMPKDMGLFGEKNGIWVCTYNEVRALAHVLRSSVLKVFAVAKSQDNKGDKMHLLYDYLTSNEFSEQWKAIREGFLAMRHSIDTERSQMEKLWKSREKQLDKILLNASHISGSVEGIAGTENIDIKLLDE